MWVERKMRYLIFDVDSDEERPSFSPEVGDGVPVWIEELGSEYLEVGEKGWLWCEIEETWVGRRAEAWE